MSALVWTNSPPTLPGWYWWRHPYPRINGFKVEIIHLYSFHIKDMKHFEGYSWSGPIPEPQEPLSDPTPK